MDENSMIQTPVEISSDNNASEQLQYFTSANYLCNFMRERDFLIRILKDLAIRPRYFEERIDYLRIPDRKTITFPMTCFCDIPLSKTQHHMKIYGQYGIALNKKYCIEKDVQPIMYLNANSRLTDDYSSTFRKLFESEKQIDEEWRFLPNAILGQLLYTKPIEGEMRRENKQPKHLLFKDECEWRFIPKIPQGMPLIMPSGDNTAKGRKYYSDALGRDKSTWFSFGIENIEYIIVPNEIEALEIINAINRMTKIHKMRDRHRLMSKIEIAQKFSENLA